MLFLKVERMNIIWAAIFSLWSQKSLSIIVKSTLPQKSNVVCSVNIFPHHWNEKRRLRSVQVVASSSIWNHSELFNQMDEV